MHFALCKKTAHFLRPQPLFRTGGKKTMRKFFAGMAILLFIFIETGVAQNIPAAWSVNGSLRYRLEKYSGYNARNYGDAGATALGELYDTMLLQRLIVGVSGAPGKNMLLALHLQDSRAFGWSLRDSKEPQAFRTGDKNGTAFYIMNPQEEFFEIYDAYWQVRQLFPHTVLTLGRQKIYCADYRIFGPGEWGNTGRWTWDALRLNWQRDRASVEAWAGGTKIHDPHKTHLLFSHTEFLGAGMYGSCKARGFAFDLFAAVKRPGSADYMRDQSFTRYWSGFRIDHTSLRGAVYEISVTKGFGDQRGQWIDSYGLFTKLGWSFGSLGWRPVITARYSWASGDNPITGAVEQFDPVYGASDKYYGWMNLVQWSNLDDREIVAEFFPAPSTRIEVKYNRFYIPHPTGAINGTLILLEGQNHLGDELDIFIKSALSKKANLVLAASWFAPWDAKYRDGRLPKQTFWLATQLEYYLIHPLKQSEISSRSL